PQVTHCASELKEGQYIAREIRRILGGLDLNEYTYDHSRYSFSDIAVVYRSHEVGTKIDSCLRKDNLPTFRFGENSFKEQPEIKHTLSILVLSIPKPYLLSYSMR
ncbi:MAG: 3'-5' exonuclease, partial [Candidatus Paceibacteria bacterium]